MFYRTKNLTFAAYLRHQGLVLDKAERGKGSQVTFVFCDPNQDAERYQVPFQNGDVEVNLSQFMAHLNGLRDLIFKEAK